MKKIKKLKVLISIYSFKNLTGSEMSVYELGCELVRQGVDVTIIAGVVGEPMVSMGRMKGIKINNINNTLNNTKNYDILHLNHPPIASKILKLYPNVPAVMHVRSEIIPNMEYPLIHPQIKHYISIREGVSKFIKSFGINDDIITIINNPFDINRFNNNYDVEGTKENAALFIGTLNPPIRKQMLLDLHEHTKKNGEELWIIGVDYGILHELTGIHVKYLGEQLNPETFIKKCKYTAGILKGRTTIEGWLCGKGGLIYDVDNQGNIHSKDFYDVPDDIIKYHSDITTKTLIDLYNKIIIM